MTKKQQKAKNAISRVTVNMNLSTKVFKDKKHPSRGDNKRQLRKEIMNYVQCDDDDSDVQPAVFCREKLYQ